jgi:hypothetical protein
LPKKRFFCAAVLHSNRKKNLWERGMNMSTDESNSNEYGKSMRRWVGPTFFTTVLIAVIVFFVWFLRA